MPNASLGSLLGSHSLTAARLIAIGLRKHIATKTRRLLLSKLVELVRNDSRELSSSRGSIFRLFVGTLSLRRTSKSISGLGILRAGMLCMLDCAQMLIPQKHLELRASFKNTQ